MQKTGIVRRVDDLGRIVIPKEIRKTLKIREGDELLISLQNENQVILQKYEPLGAVMKICDDYIETLAKISNSTCLLIDLEKVLFAHGGISRIYRNKSIKEKFSLKLQEKNISIREKRIFNIVDDENMADISDEIIAPLFIDGSLIGAIIMLTNNFTKKYGIVEEKLLEQAIEFFKSQMEI